MGGLNKKAQAGQLFTGDNNQWNNLQLLGITAMGKDCQSKEGTAAPEQCAVPKEKEVIKEGSGQLPGT